MILQEQKPFPNAITKCIEELAERFPEEPFSIICLDDTQIHLFEDILKRLGFLNEKETIESNKDALVFKRTSADEPGIYFYRNIETLGEELVLGNTPEVGVLIDKDSGELQISSFGGNWPIQVYRGALSSFPSDVSREFAYAMVDAINSNTNALTD